MSQLRKRTATHDEIVASAERLLRHVSVVKSQSGAKSVESLEASIAALREAHAKMCPEGDAGFGTDSETEPDEDVAEMGEETEVATTEISSERKMVPPTPIKAPPSALDNFLDKYGAFSAATFSADQGLKILQWSSWAISYANRRHPGRVRLSEGLRKLYGDMGMTRYALRFYGFLQSLEGYRSGSWAGGTWEDGRIAKIAKYLMCGSMLAYYPLEHLAYAGWQMPKLVRVDANRVSALSCVFWTLYIVGDFWTSCLKVRELKRKLADLRQAFLQKKGNDEKDAAADLVEEERGITKKIRLVKLQVLRCLLFIGPAVHWSMPNWATDPLFSEFAVNGSMLVEAYTCVYQSICAMSK